jgi:hypothetical protein
MKRSFAFRAPRGARWQAWLAAYVLLALIWPAIGPLPWLVDFAPAGTAIDSDADAHDGANHHHDASEIPGSPTHPDDHNCFQCDVIKHLSRCVPSDGAFPVVALVTASPLQPAVEVGSIHAASVVPRPPIRGPPHLNG